MTVDPSSSLVDAGQTLTLLARSRSSDEALARDAAEQLLALHGPWIEKVVRACGRRYDVQLGGEFEQDLLQTGRLTFWEAVDSYAGIREAAFTTFANRCIWNAVLKEIIRENRVTSALIPLDLEAGAAASAADEDASPASHFQAAALQAGVRRFAAGLPLPLREVIVRMHWRGERPSDIAKEMGISRTAVYNRLARVAELGRDALAQLAPAA